MIPMINAVFSAASDEMRSRFLRLGFRGVGNGIGSNGSSVLVVVELLLVSRLLPSVDGCLLLILPVVLYPFVDGGGISDVLEYGLVLL
jgi:hypothetical protein